MMCHIEKTVQTMVGVYLYILLINSFHNIINEPTRGHALLDAILIPLEYPVLDKGVFDLPPLISDHKVPFITVPFDYPVSSSYKRLIWLYKRGNYQQLKESFDSYDWNFINDAPINNVAKIFENTFLGLVNECIPSKEATIHTDDKPWYDFAIKKYSRLRDKLRRKALKTQSKHTGMHINLHVIK